MQFTAKLFFLSMVMYSLTACQTAVNKPVSMQEDTLSLGLINDHWPVTNDYRKTTSSSLYLGNLNARIIRLETLYSSLGSVRFATQLAANYYHRYRVMGRIDDGKKALFYVDEIARFEGLPNTSYWVQASITSGFHQFDKALSFLNDAHKSQVIDRNIVQRIDEIERARGSSDVTFDRELRSYSDFVSQANSEFEHNRFLNGSLLLRQAQSAYADTNPFPLAWIHLQQGIAYLRYDNLPAAKHFFQAAHERFPEYYLATEHLAETEKLLGNLERAQELYWQVAEQTNNPEFYAQLEIIERKLGNHNAANLAADKAAALFSVLIREFPLAMGDHAVNYYLSKDEGGTALHLARVNIENRQDIHSWLLLAKTESFNLNTNRACRALSNAKKTGLNPPELRQLDAELRVDCDQHRSGAVFER